MAVMRPHGGLTNGKPLNCYRARHQVAAWGAAAPDAGVASPAGIDEIHVRPLGIVCEDEQPRQRIRVHVQDSGFRIV